jgi:hypothetical protein
MTLGRATMAAVLLATVAVAAEPPRRRLPGTVPRGLAQATDAGRAPADLRLEHVRVFLGLRDRGRLDAVIAAQQDRRSPRYRRWLDDTEIADRFGPRRADYERVRAWLTAHGLEVVRESRSRISLVVAGSAAQIETALATPIRLVRRAGRTYRTPLVDPSVPEDIAADVRAIFGLDDLPKFRPLVQVDGGGTALGPDDFATVYDLNGLRAAGITGAGRSIAILARSNFRDSDIAHFSERFLGAPLTPTRKLVDPSRDPGIPDVFEEREVLLDTQWAGAVAPGAQVNVVISTREGDIPESLEKAIDDREGDVISISFGVCDLVNPVIATELFDAFYTIANAKGQTVVVASGDFGPVECFPDEPHRFSVNALASSPHAVAVGGTSFSLAPDGTLPAVLEESVWKDGFGASGGGQSLVFALPRYQANAGIAVLASGRALPDLALAGSPLTPGYAVVQNGEALAVGGTSAGAPAFAGILALVNERLVQREGRAGLGQLLPSLYRLASEQARGLRPAVFRDVVLGDNGGFLATPGFDFATGWGSPLGAPLAEALGTPGPCEPAIGCLVPARGARRRACAGEWLVEKTVFDAQQGLPAVRQTCTDGDPGCDADGIADGRCTVNVALCLNVFDFRILTARGIPACQPGSVRGVRLMSPRARPHDAVASANRAALAEAVAGLPDFPITLDGACTATVPVVVPVATHGTKGRQRLRATVRTSVGRTRVRLDLLCVAP